MEPEGRLFFDTETTGKLNKGLPLNHETQPRIVQIGAILKDGGEVTISELNIIIKPDGFTIPKQASDIHGITNEVAHQYGVPLIIALAVFNHMSRKCRQRIAHNLNYDDSVITGEFMRIGKEWAKPLQPVCTMNSMIEECAIPGKFGKSKWPSLSETYQHVFDEAPPNTHNAMWDTTACMNVFYWMIGNQIKLLGSV